MVAARPGSLRRVGATVSLLAALSTPALAHEVHSSALNLQVTDTGLSGTLEVHAGDVSRVLGVPPQTLLDGPGPDRPYDTIVALLTRWLSVAADGHSLRAQWGTPTVAPDREALVWPVSFTTPTRPGLVRIAGPLFPADANHQLFLNIDDGGRVQPFILGGATTSVEYATGGRSSIRGIVQRFFPAGIEHILGGPDHLLFVAALLLAGGTLARLAVIVSVFTVAHSITLALSALDIVTLPGRIVEPAIAMSIAVVGIANVLGTKRDARPWMAFVFGLIHGFGFATILRDTQLPANGVVWSLAAFNLGVEAGQAAVIAVLALALLALDRMVPRTGVLVRHGGSVLVIGVASVWFVQRLVS